MAHHLGLASVTKPNVGVFTGSRFATGTTTHRSHDGANGFAGADDALCLPDDNLHEERNDARDQGGLRDEWADVETSSEVRRDRGAGVSLAENLCWSEVETHSYSRSGLSIKVNLGGYGTAYGAMDTTSSCLVGMAYHYVPPMIFKKQEARRDRPSLLRQVINSGWAWFGLRPKSL